MYWPSLHALMPGIIPTEARNWRKNIIDYPQIVTHDMHLRHSMFKKEIL